MEKSVGESCVIAFGCLAKVAGNEICTKYLLCFIKRAPVDQNTTECAQRQDGLHGGGKTIVSPFVNAFLKHTHAKKNICIKYLFMILAL